MARFNANQADNYGGNGGGGFFSLRDDGDQARVRFMYDSFDDVEAFSVHKVANPKNPKSSYYVNCLREYNDPVDMCPFCREHMNTTVKLFIPLYDVESGQAKTWDRGKKFISRISSICKRYEKDSLVSHTFTIERNGAAGDTSTTYEIWEDGQDDTVLEDLPELPNVPVHDKSAEDMEYFLEEGWFPPEDGDDGEQYEEERPKRRPSRNESRGSRGTRRTPAGRTGKESF